jgi:hypothetical protein
MPPNCPDQIMGFGGLSASVYNMGFGASYDQLRNVLNNNMAVCITPSTLNHDYKQYMAECDKALAT